MKTRTKVQYKVPLLVIIELVVGVSASILSFLLFLKLASSIESDQQLDTIVNTLVYEWRTPLLTQVMVLITTLGNELLLILLVGIFLFSIVKKHKREAFRVMLVVLLGVIINLILKEIIGRERPTASPLMLEPLYSFPSGHSMNAFVFYSMLVLYVRRVSRSWRLTAISASVNGCIIVLIGLSRVYLGVHYLTDVLAGFLAGFCWITIALVVEKSAALLSMRRKNTT